MEWKIPLFKIYWDENDIEAVSKSIKRGMSWALGPEINEFEKKISEYIEVNHTLLFNSGTSALHACMLAYDIKKGDEVIVPSFSFISTANTPLFVKATPVFADIEEETFGLDPDDVNEKITKNTKAIIPMHHGGTICKIKELKKLAEDHDLILIEDNAESFGSMIDNKKTGSFGDCSVASFCANKPISTGEGGAVLTNSDEIYEKLKLIRSHGRLETKNYFDSNCFMDYVELGYNFRMSTILASLGLSQFSKIEDIIQMRNEKAKYMTKKLSGIKEIKTINVPKNSRYVYQMYTIRVKNGKREELMKHLESKGVMSKVFFTPIHETHFYSKILKQKPVLPITEKISKEVLSLPIFPTLTKDEMDFITDEINNFFAR